MNLGTPLQSLLLVALVVAALLQSGPALAGQGLHLQAHQALQAAARDKLPPSVVDVSVRKLVLRGDTDLPEGEVRLAVSADASEDWIGRVSATIDVSVDGQWLRELTASLQVEALVEVPVVLSPVQRGQVIRDGQVALARRDLATLPRGTARSLGQVLGRTVRRDLEINQLLRDSDLDAAVDARRGQQVTLVVRSGDLEVRAPGVLRQDARVGDRVDVTSTQTRRVVQGLLVSRDRVELPGRLR